VQEKCTQLTCALLDTNLLKDLFLQQGLTREAFALFSQGIVTGGGRAAHVTPLQEGPRPDLRERPRTAGVWGGKGLSRGSIVAPTKVNQPPSPDLPLDLHFISSAQHLRDVPITFPPLPPSFSSLSCCLVVARDLRAKVEFT
jgi:hypothetical protein